LNPYLILGLEPNTPINEVKKAYRKLAMTCHPDRDNSNGEKFKTITQAFNDIRNNIKQNQFIPKQTVTSSVTISIQDILLNDEKLVSIMLPDRSIFNAKITIPNGVINNSVVRYANLIANNVDLKLIFRIQPELSWDIINNIDLVKTIKLDVFKLITGTQLELELLTNKIISITIPPKTQPNTKMKIHGHGLSYSQHVGDLYLIIEAFIPTDIPEELIALIS